MCYGMDKMGLRWRRRTRWSSLSILVKELVAADIGNYPDFHAAMQSVQSIWTHRIWISSFIHVSQSQNTWKHNSSALQPVEGQESWPISDMLRPHPPPYVRKPGRKKTKRTREVGEKPAGTKLNKVGVQMRCSLCRKTTHNIRKCPYNKEAGKRKNAHIKRDAAKKRKQSEAATVAEGSSVRKFHIAFLFFLFC